MRKGESLNRLTTQNETEKTARFRDPNGGEKKCSNRWVDERTFAEWDSESGAARGGKAYESVGPSLGEESFAGVKDGGKELLCKTLLK